LAPQSGSLFRNPRLKVGYFAQHQTDELTMDETPIDHMARAIPGASVQQVRGQLARFGLDVDRAGTRIQALSGGEKARLLLALATRDAPQLLILDEPTNHLDIDAREALVRALAEFSGAVLLITHDPHLVELVADRLWLVGDGTVQNYDGDMDEYRSLLSERARPASRNDGTNNRRDERRERADARAAMAPLRKRAKDAEARIARLEKERATIEAQLSKTGIYAAGRGGEVAAAQSKLGAVRKLIDAAEADWLDAAAELERATSAMA
jgi:ATP-binding cassette subfamily F protein 3